MTMPVPKPRSNDQKAYLLTESKKKIPCLFNPAELTLTMSTTWGVPTPPKDDKADDGAAPAAAATPAAVPGKDAPQLEFTGGDSGSLSLDLFFDTTKTGKPVTQHTNELVKLGQIDKTLPGYDATANNGRPPWVKFHWGKFHSFKAVLTDLTLNFLLFSATGEPLRAKASITLKQYEQEDDWPRQNPTSGTPAPARSHQIQPGETLDRIAADQYDDPTAWRRLAVANDIRDPFATRPGRRINVPTLEH